MFARVAELNYIGFKLHPSSIPKQVDFAQAFNEGQLSWFLKVWEY